MTADRDAVAEVLAVHHWGDDTAQAGHHAVQCGCGWKDYEPSGDIYALRARHDQHRADALAGVIAAKQAEALAVEWGVRYEALDPEPLHSATRTQVVESEQIARAAVKNGAPIRALNRRVVTRRVSEWIEAER